MTRKTRPGSGVGAPPRPNQNNNALSYTLSPVASLALEKAKRLLKGLPAREQDIHARVLRQLHGTGIPAPDHIQVLISQAGSDESVKKDCERLARELNASVLICDPNGKILAHVWWT
jgi:hypothetical protein